MKALRQLFLVLSIFFAASVWAQAVNINTADAETLSNLDGIGMAKAQAIISYREQNGEFKTVDELVEVDGIGAKTLEKLKSEIVVK